jgi:predicted enzyme related to lactoylglutathione lyase
MIRGVHTMFYSSDAEGLRAFLRDKLKFPFTDVGGGRLIFDLPEADMGCHPAGPPGGEPAGTHSVSFYCDDVHKTVAELKGRGVEFVDGIVDQGYGLVTHFAMPGGVVVQLYQPKYAKKPRRPAVRSSGRSTRRTGKRPGRGRSSASR